MLAAAGSLQAQGTFQVTRTTTVNAPNRYIAPGLTQAQYLANVVNTMRTMSSVPPWMYGYNPYPSPVISPLPPISPAFNPLLSPYGAGAYSPYNPALYGAGTVNPYAAGGGYSGTTNPYSPYGTDSSVSPYSSSPYYNPYETPLSGAANVMRATSDLIQGQEKARIMREQALQAKLETQKKKFDTEMYIKANTPTPTEIQQKNARQTLMRITSNSNPTEIANGKSQNYLLDDLRKYTAAKSNLEPLPMSEDLLQKINVTKSFGNPGILRNDGKIAWPGALLDLLPTEKRHEIENQALALYKGAMNGRADSNLIKDFNSELDRVNDDLLKRANEIGSNQYLEAKRFLNDWKDARISLEQGDFPAQAAFQKFAEGGKTVQEVVDYMVKNGLKFAPSVGGDENAYQALFTNLAALDVAVNAQVASYTPPDSTPP